MKRLCLLGASREPQVHLRHAAPRAPLLCTILALLKELLRADDPYLLLRNY